MGSPGISEKIRQRRHINGWFCLFALFLVTHTHYSELSEGPLVDPYIDSTYTVKSKRVEPITGKKAIVLERVQIL